MWGCDTLSSQWGAQKHLLGLNRAVEEGLGTTPPPPEPVIKMKLQIDGVARFIKDMNKNQKPGRVSTRGSAWGVGGQYVQKCNTVVEQGGRRYGSRGHTDQV